jgi:hypothetical protein
MHEVDGYKVSCSVAQTDAVGRYRVKLVTVALQGGRQRTWDIPGERSFTTQLEAERYGRYVILGLRAVAADGQPMYTVV